MLSVSLLGDFCIRHDETPVTDVDTPRLQSLLAFLLLHSDAPQSRAHVAYLFWPDTTEAQARTNLRNLLHHLRRVLPQADSHLGASVQTLRWRSDAPFSLDVSDFLAALADAEKASQASDPAAVRAALERAVALYRGDLLPSCYDDWIIPQREGLRQAYFSALERLIRMLEEQRDYTGATQTAQLLLRHDPLHEATYRRLIRLLALDGDRAGALRVYHTCTTVLRRELDVEPSAATREAYEQLLGAESRPLPATQSTPGFSPVVGRENEWAVMLRAWRGVAAGGEPHVVILSGEAGIGKTRLTEDLLQWAARQGIANASARCYAAEGELAYAPVTAWLRANPLAPLEDVWLAELARLLPEVLARRPDLPRPVALNEAWQRQRLFEALSQAILRTSQTLLLVIDDLQWCDRDTLEWLHFLLRFDRGARLLVAGTYRTEEVGEGHPLASSLQALRLEGQVTEIELRPLDETATQTLASHIAGTEISAETAQLLYRETEGNPLFVVETVRAGLPLQVEGSTTGTARTLPHAIMPGGLPPKVRSVLGARLSQLSAPARELAELAATIGRLFSFKLIASASSCDADALVRELDELWQRRIVRERGTDSYDFSHDKLREVAYAGISAARRRLLHRHVAQALETLHAAELNPVSLQVAAHYERAGLAEQAAPFYLRAAEVARQVYANEEALALLRRGLALVDDLVPGGGGSERGHEVAAQLWEELGDVLELKAQHGEALQAYNNAQGQVPHGERIWQARLHRKSGAVMREQRLYAESLVACHRAEIVLDLQPDKDAGGWWDEWVEVRVAQVWAYYWLARWPEMEELVDKVQPVVQARGGVASRVAFLTASCLMRLRKERYVVADETLSTAREALSASRELGDLKAIIECQFEVGFLHLWRLELDAAEENLQAALELVETSGVVRMRTLIQTYLTVVCRFRGREDGVRHHARLAEDAAIAAKMPDYLAAAKGNQAWLAWRGRNLPAAEELGQDALALWRQSPLVYPFQWLALWPLIAVAQLRDRRDVVWSFAEALLQPTQQRLPHGLNTALEAALRARAESRGMEADTHLDRAVECAQELGYL